MDAGVAESTVEQLKVDFRQANLAPPDREMLAYSVKLTQTPESMLAVDVDRLRSAGFDDRGIHDICSIVAYFAFVNRIADGLGVSLESSFDG